MARGRGQGADTPGLRAVPSLPGVKTDPIGFILQWQRLNDAEKAAFDWPEDLSYMDLSSLDFGRSNIGSSDFMGANLKGANLAQVSLDDPYLNGVEIDAYTRLHPSLVNSLDPSSRARYLQWNKLDAVEHEVLQDNPHLSPEVYESGKTRVVSWRDSNHRLRGPILDEKLLASRVVYRDGKLVGYSCSLQEIRGPNAHRSADNFPARVYSKDGVEGKSWLDKALKNLTPTVIEYRNEYGKLSSSTYQIESEFNDKIIHNSLAAYIQRMNIYPHPVLTKSEKNTWFKPGDNWMQLPARTVITPKGVHMYWLSMNGDPRMEAHINHEGRVVVHNRSLQYPDQFPYGTVIHDGAVTQHQHQRRMPGANLNEPIFQLARSTWKNGKGMERRIDLRDKDGNLHSPGDFEPSEEVWTPTRFKGDNFDIGKPDGSGQPPLMQPLNRGCYSVIRRWHDRGKLIKEETKTIRPVDLD